MSTNYPTSLDTYYDKVDNVSTVYATSINNLQDAMAALQAKVGINDSNATTTLDYKVGDFFNTTLPRQMYFYQSSPPVGWSTSGVATSCVLAVKGGAQDWNADGGQRPGDWPIDDQATDSQNHHFLASYGSNPWSYSYQSDGTTANYPEKSGVTASMDLSYGVIGWYSYVPAGSGDRTYTISKHYYTNLDGHSHTFAGNWRPLSYVGILAKYTGA
jgi:hypothetical protein